MECSISNFACYIPKNVVKPRPDDWGTSLCKICLNPELKVEPLKDSEINLEVLLSLEDIQLKSWSDQLKNNNKLITCIQRMTDPKSQTKTKTVTDDSAHCVSVNNTALVYQCNDSVS